MAFVIPFIAGALGLGATATALFEIGAAVGIGLLSQKLTGAKKTKGQGGQSLSLQIEADKPRTIVFGKRCIAGSLEYWQLYGSHNKFLQMVIALADHECDGLDGVWVDGKFKTIDESGDVEGYSGKLNIEFHSGTSTQAASASVIANSGGRWTADDRGLNVCYVVVTVQTDDKLFPSVPQLVFALRGFNKLIHPVTGVPGYSRNPAIILWNVLRGITVGGEHLIGMHVPSVAIRAADVTEAISISDENVGLLAGGTEKRYCCDIDLTTDMTNRQLIELIVGSMAGSCIETGGIYRILAGAARSSVMSLTDADLVLDRKFVTDPKRPRSELISAISASYTNRDLMGKVVPLPTRASSVDAAEDGGIVLWKDLDLSPVSSRTQGQRIMEIERKRARRQYVVSGAFGPRCCVLEPGDWLLLSSDQRSISDATFEVAAVRVAEDCTTELDLVEVDSAIDDWLSGDEIGDTDVTDLSSAGPSEADIAVTGVEAITITNGSTLQIPALRLTFTPPDDYTVTGVDIQFRRVGDTTPIVAGTADADDGSFLWTSGVQAATAYEARARLRTLPRRAVHWSGWVAAADDTPPQIVGTALVATSVPPDTITGDMLAPLERFQIRLIEAAAEIQGSVNERLQTVAYEIATLAEAAQRIRQSVSSLGGHVTTVAQEATSADLALAQQINTVSARLNTGDIALFRQDIETRVGTVEGVAAGRTTVFMQADAPTATAIGDLWIQTDEDNALYVASTLGTSGWVYAGDGRIFSTARDLSLITTRVGDAEANVFDLSESLGGVLARRVLGVDANGHAAQIAMNGTSYGSNIIFSAEGFHFTDPRINGGEGFSIVVPEDVGGGVWQAFIDGDLLVRSVTANSASFGSLSAINATLGDVYYGRLISADGAAVLDGDAQKWSNTVGSFLDMKAGRLLLKGAV